MAITLNSKITELAGVGDFYAKKLNHLGIKPLKIYFFIFPVDGMTFLKSPRLPA
jgi:hypothetical protein